MIKAIITRLLEGQARRVLHKYKPKVVAVVGSVGKTSTKIAIATVLSQKYRVLAHYGGYNTPIALPLALFDMSLPLELRNPFSWFKVYFAMAGAFRHNYPYDVVVLELGADHPGDIEYFRRYIHPDIAVVTAVAEEHMEFFKTLDAVAKEELAIAQFANLTLINRDNVSEDFTKYVPDGTNLDTYGTSGIAEYHFLTDNVMPGQGFSGKFVSPELKEVPVTLHVAGEHAIRAVVAAGAVGAKMGLNADQITKGMQQVRPVSGRMNILKGLERSTIIDDSYNSSPIAAIAALQSLYAFPAPQRIAVLGSMNELGGFSPEAHKRVGLACDPALIDWVITVGDEAQKYLAPAAKSKGCRVKSYASPYDAGAEVRRLMQPNSVILVKGSQNRVFTEETAKMLLHSTEEESQLVRQSADWLAIKQKQFGASVK